MSLQSFTGNVGAGLENVGETALSGISSTLEAIIGTVKTGLGNIWSGGFAGISKTQIENVLIPAIDNYCKEIEEKIASFNAEADLSQTFAGEGLRTDIKGFVEAIKTLLQAYVSTMRAEKDRVWKAYDKWEMGTADVQSNVQESASSIRNMASNIKLD